MKSLCELRSYLSELSSRCLQQRWLGAHFHVGVCADIAEDISAERGEAAKTAETAKDEDVRAEELLRSALADGKLDADDLPLVRKALRHISRSAEMDGALFHQLTS